jgi:ribosomal protein L23
MMLKPLVTEKAVMMIESQNILTFTTEKERTKEEIKK